MEDSKYSRIKELGLQVFSKPLSSHEMLVSADELSIILNSCERRTYSEYSILEVAIIHTPKTLEEKIQKLLSDKSMSKYEVLEEIRKLVEEK